MLVKFKFTFEDTQISEKLSGDFNEKLIEMNTYSYLITRNPKKSNEYIFTPKSKTWVYHNSFIPMVYMYKDSGRQVKVLYRLQFSVRLILLIILSVAMLFELTFLGLCACGIMSFNIALLIPVAIVLFLYGFAILAMYINAIRINSQIFVVNTE